MSESAIRIGLVGLGVHGLRYARTLATDAPGARLAALCRRNPDAARAFAEEMGAPLLTDWRAVVGSADVDAVAVVTPPDSHAEIAVAAARAGKHVLVEKPMAASSAECREMIRAAEENGVRLAVAQTLRFEAPVLELRRRIAERGPPLTMSLVHRLESRRVRSGRTPPPAWDSCLFDTAIHLLDAARFLAGQEALEVSARTEWEGRLAGNLVLATLRLSGGAVAAVEAASLTSARASRIEAVWDDLQLSADLGAGTLTARRGREAETLAVPPAPRPIEAALADFVRAIRDGRAPAVTGEDGLRAVEIAVACLASGREGRAVAV